MTNVCYKCSFFISGNSRAYVDRGVKEVSDPEGVQLEDEVAGKSVAGHQSQESDHR